MLAVEHDTMMKDEKQGPHVPDAASAVIPAPPSKARTLTRSSAVSQKSVELSFSPETSANPLNKSRLATQRSVPENQTTAKRALDLRRTKNSSIESTISLPNQKSLDKKQASLLHQKSINTQSDIVLSTQHSISDDRKALRDALYQGIFHRHRRTIFAVGSFLRMLRSKNSNYDSIRSDSDDV